MKKFLIETTKRAGKILMRYFRADSKLTLMRGSVKEVTTKYDKMVDQFILKTLKKKFPKYNFLTEESGLIDKKSDYTWVIDSLDGTVNFAYGNPLFSICLALLKKNQPILGIIYAPALNELYYAEKNKGAFLNNRRIRVTKINDLSKSYVYVCEGGDKNRQQTVKIMAKIYPEVVDLRKLGSAGLECAWLAAGRAEGYVTTAIEPWDVAAGVLIVREAGGRVTNFYGKPWQPIRSDLVFSNSRIHQKLINLVKNL
jgi:myo-inositol-1(or 4)-monophosphatase